MAPGTCREGSRSFVAALVTKIAQWRGPGRLGAESPTTGGRDNGRPGLRDYHPGYYSAYVLDPDGKNIEAVFHGPVQRSAESVVLTPEG
jgi:hypothetical protein